MSESPELLSMLPGERSGLESLESTRRSWRRRRCQSEREKEVRDVVGWSYWPLDAVPAER